MILKLFGLQVIALFNKYYQEVRVLLFVTYCWGLPLTNGIKRGDSSDSFFQDAARVTPLNTYSVPFFTISLNINHLELNWVEFFILFSFLHFFFYAIACILMYMYITFIYLYSLFFFFRPQWIFFTIFSVSWYNQLIKLIPVYNCQLLFRDLLL